MSFIAWTKVDACSDRMQIRNSNIEILNKSQYQMIKIRNLFRGFENLNFGLVSDLGFRASDFARGTSSAKVQQKFRILRYL
jgi:hypothetical protein